MAIYKRILLKISGEALTGNGNHGIQPEVIQRIAKEVAEISHLKLEIGVVIGGGNIFRGVAASTYGMDRANSDYMGMLATCINALALQESLEKLGVQTRVQSAIEMAEIAEPYIRRRAIRHLERNRLVIFAAGTGNPYFTTDTAAALRAMEINADIIFKATKVDGVFNKDPENHSDAQKYEELKYIDVLQKELKIMDSTAISLCMENKLPILIFNLNIPGNIKRAVLGEKIGTIIKGTNNE